MPAITDLLTAIGADITALVAVVAVVPAFRAVKESRQLREDQARPFVVVTREPSSTSRHFFYLVVRNHGKTIARNVRFIFDKPLRSTIDSAGYPIEDVKFLSDGIVTFAPGAEYRVLFDSIPARQGTGLPDSYTVTVRYDNATGGALPPEEYVLDSGLSRSAPFVQELTVNDLVNEVVKLRKTFEAWTQESK
jgi:hypothetical protein